MNVEFLIHGALTGQDYWKETDKDYCSRAYAPRPENLVMEIEVVRRNDGKYSTYYNYLRYNNIVSTRKGAYFGITVRIDDMICCDVENMYNVLDTIFNKCIVGTLFNLKNNSYVYACDSFKSKDAELKNIEAKFGNMCNSIFISGNDFVSIPTSYNRKNGLQKMNVEDVTTSNAKDILLSGNKLYVSPYFPTKQSQTVQNQIIAIQDEANQRIKAIQEDCMKQIQSKTQELEKANSASASGKAQLKNEIKQLKQQLQEKENELQQTKSYYKTQKLNADINQTVKELKEPIKKLAVIMAERFPENDDFDVSVCDKSGSKVIRKRKPSLIALYWKPWFATLLFIGLCGCFAWFFGLFSLNEEPEKKSAETTQQVDSQISTSNDSQEISAEYNKCRIDIDGYTGQGPLFVGMTYTFDIKGQNSPSDGEWYVNHNGINDEKLSEGKYTIPEEIGTELTIKYIYNQQLVAERTIPVKVKN